MISSILPPTVKPEVEFIVDLLTQIETGRLRAPRFQRPFVWRPRQMRDLFDSIERGFPVGTLLLWDTDVDYRSLDTMGLLRLPPRPSGTISYLLDGHQRLSTLYSVLRLPVDHPRDLDDGSWKWSIFRNLAVWGQDGQSEGNSQDSRFEHIRRGALLREHFPLRATLKTTDFLAFARGLESNLPEDHSRSEIDALIERAEEVANRIKTYKMGIIRVVGGSLSEAVEIFSRLNSMGQKIRPDQMVSALTYREDESGGFSLSEELDGIQDDLKYLGYGEIERDVVFRTVLAATGQSDIQRTDWSRLAQNIEDDVSSGIEIARKSLASTILFLRDYVGAPLARLVPYAAQFVQIAAFFIECPLPSDAQQKALERWFWSTSFSGWFAGANTTKLKNSIVSMQGFARGEVEADGLLGYQEEALPYPARFDLQAARVRILLLWQLRERKPLDANGGAIDVGREMALHGTKSWRHILRNQLRGLECRFDPANRILLSTEKGKSIRQTIVDLKPDSEAHMKVLESHFISADARQALVDLDYERFIERRSASLAAGERKFLHDLGLSPSVRERSEPDIDTY